jgi:DNA-binding MarR family transcriptional regulator
MTQDNESLAAMVQAALEAQQALRQAMHGAVMPDWAHLDLSMGQFKAMVALASAGELNISELADWLKTSKPSASILVDRLVQLGYAERKEDRDDRRRTLVALSAAGSELVDRLQRTGGERMQLWLEQMSSDDLAALTRGLRALASVVSREVAGAEGGERALLGLSSRNSAATQDHITR